MSIYLFVRQDLGARNTYDKFLKYEQGLAVSKWLLSSSLNCLGLFPGHLPIRTDYQGGKKKNLIKYVTYPSCLVGARRISHYLFFLASSQKV